MSLPLFKSFAKEHLFLLSFFLLFLGYILIYPTLSYASEVYAEQGGYFLYQAYNETARENVWTTHAGYITLLNYLVSLFVSLFASPYLYIYITNILGLALAAFCVAFINHKALRGLIPSDRTRFFISLVFGLIIFPHMDVFLFINASYAAFIFIPFLLLADKESMDKRELFFYGTIMTLVCITKFHFVLFFPFFSFFIYLHIRRKEYQSAQIYIGPMIAILVQLFLVFATDVTRGDGFIGFGTILNTGLWNILKGLIRGFLFIPAAYGTHFRFLGIPILDFFIGGLLSLATVGYIFYAFRKKMLSEKMFWVFILFHGIALAFGLINAIRPSTGISGVILRNEVYPFSRIGFAVYDLIWLSCVMAFLEIWNKQHIAWKLPHKFIPILVFGLSLIVGMSKTATTSKKTDFISDWKAYHKLFKREVYYIPVNPFVTGVFFGVKKGVSVDGAYYNPDNAKLPGLNVFNPGSITTTQLSTVDFKDGALTPTVSLQEKSIYSVLIQYTLSPLENIQAWAYDAQGQLLGKANTLSSRKNQYKYLVFDKPVTSVDKIVFVNKDGKPTNNLVFAILYTLDK